MKITHVLWDWNGTLLDDLDLCIETINGILSDEELTLLNRETYREKFGFPIIDYYARLGLNVKDDNFARHAEKFIGYYQPRSADCGLVSGAETVLKKIGELGMTQIILSASRRDLLENQVRAAGIFERFETLLGIGDIHAASKRDVGLAWKAQSGVAGENMLMIGDTLHDKEVADSLGAHFLYYSKGHQKAGADAVAPQNRIDDLAGVLEFLQAAGVPG